MSTVIALSRRMRILLSAMLAVSILGGCEAPLDLERVEAEASKSVHGFDHFKAVAANDRHIVAASDAGVLLVADATVSAWERIQLPTKASFVNLSICPSGRFVAIDSRRTLWVSNVQAGDWQSKPVDTPESLMGLACDRNNVVWVGASFSTLLKSSDYGESWASTTQDEDLMFTVIQGLESGLLVAAGEFGTLMFSEDGGASWERAEPLPNEFYPMGLYFMDRQTGWVSGLGGTILHTGDGGASWQRQESGTGAPLYNFSAVGERLFATGDAGTLLEFIDGRWQAVAALSGVTTYLIGAVAAGEHQLLLAGGAGTLALIDLDPDSGHAAGRENGQ